MNLGTALIETHDRIRDALASSSFSADCRALCSLVTAHHTDEDTSVFPSLLQARPDLAPVLEDLRRDHEIIAALIDRFGSSPSDLPTLAALLETHFTYEERKIVAALDTL